MIDREDGPLLSRRPLLSGLLAAGLLAACGGVKVAPSFRKTSLHVNPLTDLVAAAGMTWLVAVEPRVLLEQAALLPAVQKLVTDEMLAAYAKSHGGLDLRSMQEVVVAGYGEGARLSLARGSLDPASLERAFQARASGVEGRHIELQSDDGADTIVRLAGNFRDDRGVRGAELVLLGREAVILGDGAGPRARAAMAFSRNLLKRSKPALRTTPLDRVEKLLGDAPVRVFAPGPFSESATQSNLGGLLQVTTALGARMLVEEKNHRAVLKLSAVLLGEWERDRDAARERLSAAWNVLGASGMGRLLGLDRPLEPASVVTPKEADGSPSLWLHVSFDAETLAKSVADVLDSDIRSILR
ncbi:MAG: hypothetical protein U0174_27940 [Polyangiaceae bacterium]